MNWYVVINSGFFALKRQIRPLTSSVKRTYAKRSIEKENHLAQYEGPIPILN